MVVLMKIKAKGLEKVDLKFELWKGNVLAYKS